MKKVIVFSYLKLALNIFIFNASLFVFAKPQTKAELHLITEKQEALYKSINQASYLIAESKLETTIVLYSNFKKSIYIHSYRTNHILENNEKTNKLSYNFIHSITPSLGIIELIYPFHSFF